MMLYVTIDTNSINAKGRDPNLNKLEGWQSSQQISIAKTSVMLLELKGEARQKKAATIRTAGKSFMAGSSSRLGGGDKLGGPKAAKYCEQIAAIMFPHAPFDKLENNHRLDVEHLAIHKANGRDIFVTTDGDFLRNKERLKKELDIIVASPEEAVAQLSGALGGEQADSGASGG